MSQMARAEIRVQEAAAAADGSMTVSAWLLQCKQRQRGCCSANSVSVDVTVETVSAWMPQCKQPTQLTAVGSSNHFASCKK